MNKETLDTRLNFIIKIIGLFFLLAGVFVEFMTLTTSLYSPLAGMFHMLAIIMIVVGAVSLIAKII
ncbi:MAG: hypothetical protein ACUVQ8_06190 [Nitrososphaeria archaeon]